MRVGSILSFAVLASTASAVTFPAISRRAPRGISLTSPRSPSRYHFGGSTNLNVAGEDDEDIAVRNSGDLVYSTTIKLNGQEHHVQIDTGSSDLWICNNKKPVQPSHKFDFNVTVKYGKGVVKGPVAWAELEFGDYKVPSQAFILAAEAIDLESTLHGVNSGLLGLSFDSASEVDEAVRKVKGKSNTAGRTAISNIFHQNPAIPNFISILLGRVGDLDDEQHGVFTISEYIDEFKAIENEPKIPRYEVKKKDASKRWNAEVKGVTVNGHSVPLKSSLPGVEKNTIIGMLDTGWSFPPLDVKIADAIYSSIPGSVKIAGEETWIVPCLNTTELTFKIGGKDFPIHPLDLTMVTSAKGPDGKQYTYCVNTFQGQNVAKRFGDLDLILGDSFMKNVYTVFDWGNESDGGKEGPFMQLLSTTTFSEAIPEFLQVRAASLNSTYSEVPPSELLHVLNKTASATAVEGGRPDFEGKNVNSLASHDPNGKTFHELSNLNTYGPIILGLLAGNLLLFIILSIILLVVFIRSRGKDSSATRNPDYAPVKAVDPHHEPISLYNPYESSERRH